MNRREMWDRYRAWLVDLPGLGVRLDVSRMAMPGDYVKAMEPHLTAAFDAMEALEAGAIANPDEDRRVGHYWLRSPEAAPEDAIRDAIVETRERVRRFTSAVHGGTVAPERAARFEHVLVIGIGGSALGPQLVSDALGSPDDPMRAWFLDNTDPDGIDRVLSTIGGAIDRTLAVVISKSGGTPETRNGMLEAKARFEAAGLTFGRHATAVTGDGSHLDRFAEAHGFLERFPMWDWVGGRTSVMSAVGLVPASLQGLDVDGLLDGARGMDRATRARKAMRNPAAMLALAWHHACDGRGAKDMVVLPYKDRLALFSRYLQQLVMESLGKKRDLDGEVVHQGIAVYGNKGSTDQHAYVQQLREGVPNFFATFIRVLRDGEEGDGIEVEPGVTSGDFLDGFLLGTREALFDAGRPSLTITVPFVDARTLGMLIALYERAVGLYASLVNVNAYHQPGVEAGKKAAAAILELQRDALSALADRGDRGATADELAEVLDRPDDVETVFHVLEHLAANPARGVNREDGRSFDEAVFRVRRASR